jgi:uncharacterized protein (TIGR02996 family)
MDVERSLLEVLHRDAADHPARLALADWLEEGGRTEQAELARLHARQLMRVGTPQELARLCHLLACGVRPVGPELVNSLGMKLVLIPPGTFQMGSPAGEEGRDDGEGPLHEVELTRPFYLGAYQVTQRQFKRVTGYNPSFFSNDGTRRAGATYDFGDPAGGKANVARLDTSDYPVELVSWDEAVEFCRQLTEKERNERKIGREQEYRLPSEAEWEYSCRGGAASSQPFHFGDTLSSDLANFNGGHPYGGADKGPSLSTPFRKSFGTSSLP